MFFNKGMVVMSRAGRDSGKLQLVVAVDEAYAYVADGKEHKLEKPKRKNPKHLQRTEIVFQEIEQMTNKRLRTLLREHDIAEESGKLV